MSRIDPECFAHTSSERVCSKCFDDDHLIEHIKTEGNQGFCTYCEKKRRYVMPISEFAEHVRNRLSQFYSRAVDELPYDGREGGYQAWHVDTYDLLFEQIGLDLPKDKNNKLRYDLPSWVSEDTWCELDWLSLEYRESLLVSFSQFSDLVKSHRRFFFHDLGETDTSHPDSRSVLTFLTEVASLIDGTGLIVDTNVGELFYRARPNINGIKHSTGEALGPPPSKYATQSNRMNPPGIPMFYGASTEQLAIAETRPDGEVSIGAFISTKKLRILDFHQLPEIPGFFSSAPRRVIQGLQFLCKFTQSIAEPVPRDDRVNVDYIPTQILTEFFRDFHFEGGHVDGIRYPTSLGIEGYNTVLFASQDDLVTETMAASDAQWLKLHAVSQH